MSRVSDKFSFINFGNICSNCTNNCCKRFYAVLLPEEENDYGDSVFNIETRFGSVKCIGSRGGKPCPFLNDNGFCNIYFKRPFDCRLWPVMVYLDYTTGERIVYLDLDCPAVREGRINGELVGRIVDIVKNIDFNDDWLAKYTDAPWPNNLIEIARFKPRASKNISVVSL
ncbi:MAG: YkgJ family cysteine cluster protein [Desulfurococcaceae archaeon]